MLMGVRARGGTKYQLTRPRTQLQVAKAPDTSKAKEREMRGWRRTKGVGGRVLAVGAVQSERETLLTWEIRGAGITPLMSLQSES